MQTKSITPRFAGLIVAALAQLSVCGKSLAQDSAKAAPPLTVVVFDSVSQYDDSLPKAVFDTSDALRNDSHLEVLLFSPSSPTFILAARSTKSAIDLSQVSSSDSQNAIAVAVGGEYFVVLKSDKKAKNVSAQIFAVNSSSPEIDVPYESAKSAAADISSKIESAAAAAPVPVLSLTSVTPSATVSAPATFEPVSQPIAPVTQLSPNTAVHLSQTAEPAIQPNSDNHAPATPPVVQLANPSAVASAPKVPLAPTTAPTVAPDAHASAVPIKAKFTAVAPVSTPDSSGTPSVGVADLSVTVGGVTVEGGSDSSSSSVEPTNPVTASVPVVQPPTLAGVAPAQLPVTQPIPTVPTNQLTVIPSQSLISGATDASSAPPLVPSIATPTALSTTTQSVSRNGSGAAIDPDTASEIALGDSAMHASDSLGAIGLYKNAIDLAPRSVAPRLRLAQAYLAAGMKDQAVDEAKRALAISPGNADITAFINAQADGGGMSNDVVVSQAQTESDPSNPAAWIALGDAYWNSNDPDDSLISYKRAADIDPNGVLPQTRLAKLYAARAQYDESLAALQKSGAAGYPYALRIIASRSESLIGDLEDETDAFLKATDTREQFYAKLKETDSQAQGLAGFVSKIVPPAQYSVSHLHRELSTSLLAQTVAVWLDFAETNNDADKAQAASLEQSAVNEMKTASVAENLQSRLTP